MVKTCCSRIKTMSEKNKEKRWINDTKEELQTRILGAIRYFTYPDKEAAVKQKREEEIAKQFEIEVNIKEVE